MVVSVSPTGYCKASITHHCAWTDWRAILLLPDRVNGLWCRHAFPNHGQDLALDGSPDTVEDEASRFLQSGIWVQSGVAELLLEEWEDVASGVPRGHQLYNHVLF